MAKERLSRSDSGITSLIRTFMKSGMGLSAKTIDLIMKRIVDSGEFAPMKSHIRGLSGSTHKRINQAIDMAEEDAMKMKKSPGKDEEPKEEKPEEKKEEVKEGKMTFMNHLLNEVGTEAMDDTGAVTMDVNPEDLRDPDKKRAAMLQQRKNKSKPQRERAIRLKIKELQDRLKAIRSGGDAGGL
jgi:hypothetical protein